MPLTPPARGLPLHLYAPQRHRGVGAKVRPPRISQQGPPHAALWVLWGAAGDWILVRMQFHGRNSIVDI